MGDVSDFHSLYQSVREMPLFSCLEKDRSEKLCHDCKSGFVSAFPILVEANYS